MNRRGRVVVAGRATTPAGVLFAELHYALEGEDQRAQQVRLVGRVTPKTSAPSLPPKNRAAQPLPPDSGRAARP